MGVREFFRRIFFNTRGLLQQILVTLRDWYYKPLIHDIVLVKQALALYGNMVYACKTLTVKEDSVVIVDEDSELIVYFPDWEIWGGE